MSNQPQAGKKILFVVLGVFLSLFLALFLINQVKAVPSTPGSGSGIIKYNPAFPNSVSFSTSTVMIGTSTLDTTLLPNPPTSPSTNPKLFVNGQFVVNSIVANDIIANSINGGNFTGKIDAKNVLPGVFNQPDSGIYVFPGYLGIATTTQVGLPQALSVYGGGYFRDKISIGTANDVGSALLAENIESNSDAITGRNSSDIGESGGVGVRGIGSNNGGMGVIAETLDSVNGYDFVGFGPRSYFAGKVGIGPGVTSPAYQLEVGGTSMFENILEAKTATTTQIRWRRSTGSTFADLISPVGGGRVGISAKNVAAGAAGGLSFYVSPSTADTLAMTIIDTGNVGINTSNPQYKLEVNGTFHAATSTFTGQIQTAISGIRFSDGTVQTTYANPGTGSPSYIARWDPNDATKLASSTIYQDFNYYNFIGIGTSTPRYPLSISNTNSALFPSVLQVNGGGYPTILVTNSNSGGAGISFKNNSAGGKQYSIFSSGMGADAGSGKLVFFDNAASTSSLVINSSRDVGIGIHNPLYKLDVNGTLGVRSTATFSSATFSGSVGFNSAASFNNSATFAAGLTVTGITTITNGLVLSDESGYKKIQSFNSEPISINPSGGNVGIGIINPASTFQVNGSFSTKVVTTITGDYSVTATDHVIIAYGASTITLPLIAGTAGRQYIIKEGMSAGSVTVRRNPGETGSGGGSTGMIDWNYGTSMVLSGYQSVMLVSDGSWWWRVANF